MTFLAKAGLLERWTDKVKLPDGEFTNLKAFIRLKFEPVLDLTFGPRSLDSEAEKVDGKNGDVPIQKSLFDSESEGKKRNGSHPMPQSAESGGRNCRDLDGKNVGASGEKLSAYIEPTLVPLKDQQQQSAENEGFSVVVGFDDKSSGAAETQTVAEGANEVALQTARRTQIVVERLYNLGTGLAKKVIRDAVNANLEHCEMWAKHFAEIEEAKPSFWTDRKGSPAAALRIRLENVQQIPPSVKAQRERDEKRAEAARKADDKRTAAALARQLEDDDRRANEQFARETFARFDSLAPDVRDGALARVETGGFKVELDKSRVNLAHFVAMGVAGEIENPAARFNLACALNVAIDRALEATVAAVALSAQEIEEDDEPPLPSLLEHLQSGGPSAIVNELAREARDGMTLAEFEASRGDYTPDEWEAVRKRVESASGVTLGEARPATGADAPVEDETAARAEAARADGLWAKISDASRKMIGDEAEAKLRGLPAAGQSEDARIELQRALVCDHFDAPYNPPKRANRDHNQNSEEVQSA